MQQYHAGVIRHSAMDHRRVLYQKGLEEGPWCGDIVTAPEQS